MEKVQPQALENFLDDLRTASQRSGRAFVCIYGVFERDNCVHIGSLKHGSVRPIDVLFLGKDVADTIIEELRADTRTANEVLQ